ncbi:MAG: UbiA family prenyltransferase [Myxococcales bacterium]|nr:UbiA family prenyltransferase [Myxococcales bacterium]
MTAALKIVYGVVAFRVRKLEMANLAGALAIMLVLRMGPAEALVRGLFAALLNILIYLNNDYLDVAIDQRAPDKDAGKVAYMRAHMAQARTAQWLLLVILVAMALLGEPDLLLPLIAGGGICVAYSARLKHMPGLDILAMALWGVAMPLCGSHADSTLGWLLALQLGLISAVFESIQVIRDHDTDAALAVRTSAVAMGVPRTLWLARGLMVLASAYAAVTLHPAAGGVMLLSPLIPFKTQRAAGYWTAVKLVLGVGFVVACALCYVQAGSQGLWLRVDAGASLFGATP